MYGNTRKRIAVRLTALIITLILVLVLGTSASAVGQVVHRVSAGSPDVCEAVGLEPGCDKNFSLVAIQFADGSVSGQYDDQFGGGLGGFHAVIDCLSVEGNQAWLSGVITHGVFHDPDFGDFDLTGLPVWTTVRDNGTSQNDPPDQISLSMIGTPDTCTDQPGGPLFEVPQGQVVVK